MTKEFRYLNWVSAGVILGAIIAAALDFIPISLEKLKNADLLTLLLTVIFVALVVERAVEVYANNRFDPERARIRLPVSAIESNLAFKERRLEAELARPNPDETELSNLRQRIREAQDKLMAESEKIEPQLADFRRKKAAYAAMLATVLSLGAAIVGVRVLGQFVPTDAEGAPQLPGADPFQMDALLFVDVVLTTALLAGGADGIHQIIKRFTDIRAGQ